MNFLAHLVLAGPDPELRLGGLMADFTRPDGEGQLPAGVQRGILLHRRIDRFTDSHPRVLAGRRRCDPAYRLASGILVDLIYDHVLARDWDALGLGLDLPTFAARAYRELAEVESLLPPRMQAAARRMTQEDWLTNYREPAFLVDIVDRTARRLRRPDLLTGGGRELLRHPQAWTVDFHAFWPEVVACAATPEPSRRPSQDPSPNPPTQVPEGHGIPGARPDPDGWPTPGLRRSDTATGYCSTSTSDSPLPP